MVVYMRETPINALIKIVNLLKTIWLKEEKEDQRKFWEEKQKFILNGFVVDIIFNGI